LRGNTSGAISRKLNGIGGRKIFVNGFSGTDSILGRNPCEDVRGVLWIVGVVRI
jgi:hypothetical protein